MSGFLLSACCLGPGAPEGRPGVGGILAQRPWNLLQLLQSVLNNDLPAAE